MASMKIGGDYMRLIDADALRVFVEGRYTITWNHDYDGGIKDACIDILNFIDTAPTIDAVPVVRCKDCRWWIDGMQRCGITISATPYGHCHDGETLEEAERKDNG